MKIVVEEGGISQKEGAGAILKIFDKILRVPHEIKEDRDVNIVAFAKIPIDKFEVILCNQFDVFYPLVQK